MKQQLVELFAELEQRWQQEQKEQASIPREQAIAYWPIRKSIRCCCRSVPVLS